VLTHEADIKDLLNVAKGRGIQLHRGFYLRDDPEKGPIYILEGRAGTYVGWYDAAGNARISEHT
jgi:hypothetical protein